MVDFFTKEADAGNAIGESPDTMASLLLTLQFGTGIVGRSGISLDVLKRVIDQALPTIGPAAT